MKCPNCSFVNTDNIKTCRVCGFNLTPTDAPKPEETSNETSEPTNSDTKISKRRIIDDSEDEALDSAFKSIFGSDDDPEEDSLDVAAVERILQKKRHVHPLESETFDETASERDIEEDDFDAINAIFEKDEPISPLSKKKVIMMVLLCATLFVLLGLKQFWPDPSWKYESNVQTTETTEVESTEVESTTETVFTLGDDASLKPVNEFFKMLPEFINRGNLSILGLFENPQQALEILTSFAAIGNLEKIAEATLIESEANTDSAVYKVTTLTNRLIDGQQTQTESFWDFRVILKNDVWVLESVAVETGASITTDTTEPVTQETTEKPTEATTEKQTESTKEVTTEEKTTAESPTEPPSTHLKGFKSSGSFSGGVLTSGQDIAFARYGYHDTFERVAFDFYEWIGGKPNQPVAAITAYTASISDDGRTIGIMVSGAIEAHASQSSLDLKNSNNIESVLYSYYGNGETVEITIVLKKPSQFKAFNLESPAKLVVDIAPIE